MRFNRLNQTDRQRKANHVDRAYHNDAIRNLKHEIKLLELERESLKRTVEKLKEEIKRIN